MIKIDTPDQYQAEALRTEYTPALLSHADTAAGFKQARKLDRLLHAQLGLSSDGGELVDALKKHLIYGKPLDETNVVEECGDLLWYIALALDAIGVKLSDCMERNIAKLFARYPEKFTQEQALTRDLNAERQVLEAANPEPAIADSQRLSWLEAGGRAHFLVSRDRMLNASEHAYNRNCSLRDAIDSLMQQTP